MLVDYGNHFTMYICVLNITYFKYILFCLLYLNKTEGKIEALPIIILISKKALPSLVKV
jgi:hypothetical protein